MLALVVTIYGKVAVFWSGYPGVDAGLNTYLVLHHFAINLSHKNYQSALWSHAVP